MRPTADLGSQTFMASPTSSHHKLAASTTASLHTPGPDVLISHLLASKRSLNSITNVQRATTILATARAALESTTVLNARATYLQRSLASQLKLLRSVQFELEEAANHTQLEFTGVLKDLGVAHRRLEETLEALEHTKIAEGFKRSLAASGDAGAAPEVKINLRDFVDEKPIEALNKGIKSCIDEVQAAKRVMDGSIQVFEDDLQAVNNALGERTVSSSSTRSDLQQPNISQILKSLETHAREMAESLESLVKHFDLCVTAIKHTEGGSAAVAQTVSASDLPEGVGIEAFEAPTQPITEDEKQEMIQVLENDAAEVDEVVIEIQDRNAEMESQLEQILLWKEKKEARYEDVLAAFKLLDEASSRLPSYIGRSATYGTKWNEEKAKIEEAMAGLEGLQGVYENFLGAYDRLIVEVARRRTVKNHMEKVVKEAEVRLAKLYEEDADNRETFRLEQGDFLPVDIWPGIVSPPPKFVISREDDDGGSVPELPRKLVDEALKRLRAAEAQRYS